MMYWLFVEDGQNEQVFKNLSDVNKYIYDKYKNLAVKTILNKHNKKIKIISYIDSDDIEVVHEFVVHKIEIK